MGVAAMGCSGEALGPDPEAYTLPDEQTMAEESLYMRQVFEEAGAEEGLVLLICDANLGREGWSPRTFSRERGPR